MQNAALTKKENTIKHKNLLSPIKTSREILTFGGIKIEKNKFYRNKISVHLRDLNIEKVLVQNRYVIGYLYNNDDEIKLLNIMLPNTSAYIISYNGQTKWMYFLIEEDELLESYNTIWDKFIADIKKGFDSEIVYNKHFLKTKKKKL